MAFEFDTFKIDPETREFLAASKPVSVQPQVFELIVFLIENRDRVVPKDELVESIWDGRAVSDSTINARINAAREALGDSGDRQTFIRTLPRRGFRFVAELDTTTSLTSEKSSIASASKPSIAVMPFSDLSADNDHGFFADGMTEDLVTSLAKIGGFFVIGRNSTFAYKNTELEVQAIASELSVRYILEGSVRVAGSKIRVSVRLISGETGKQLWADRYDRVLDDIFEIQDEITGSVISQIAPELYAAEDARVRRQPTDNLGAWECFVRGLRLYSLQSAESSARAVESLERAVELDPHYAQALGLLAMTMSWRAIQRLAEFDPSIKRAHEIAALGVAADPNDPWAYLGQGLVAVHGRQSSRGIINIERAIELSPSFAYAHAMLGAAYAYAGEAEKALASVDRALQLSPRDTFLDKFHVYASLAHFQSENYQAAALSAEKALGIRPEHPNTHMLAAASYAMVDDIERARKALAEFTRLVPGTTVDNVARAISYENPDDRRRLIDGLILAGLT